MRMLEVERVGRGFWSFIVSVSLTRSLLLRLSGSMRGAHAAALWSTSYANDPSLIAAGIVTDNGFAARLTRVRTLHHISLLRLELLHF